MVPATVPTAIPRFRYCETILVTGDSSAVTELVQGVMHHRVLDEEEASADEECQHETDE